MAANTGIEWCDHTFNPWTGCQHVSPACDHCYAEAQAKRNAANFGGWGPHAERKRTSESYWRQPLLWNKRAAKEGRRARVFCASMADVFDNQVPAEWREDLWALIHDTPHLDWLLLTKRPGNMARMLPPAFMLGNAPWPWPHVWLGTTVENQAEADRRVPELLKVQARMRFLSCEPLLGQIDLDGWLPGKTSCEECDDGDVMAPPRCARTDIPRDEQCPNLRAVWHVDEGPPDADGAPAWMTAERETIGWVIAGGESGPHARPSHPDWFRGLRDQCAAAGVPYFFKQWGEFLPEYDRDRDDPDWRRCDVWNSKPGRWINLKGGHGFHGDRVHYAHRVGKKAAGALLDGAAHRAWPA
jgi:protein gp37